MKKFTLLLTLLLAFTIEAQKKNDLPYYEIPNHPETYTASNVAARMVDGLGFRYYWSTEGLRAEDLNYKPSESGRTCEETIDHIYGLSTFILASISKEERQKMTFDSFGAKRKQTLLNFKTASGILRNTEDLSQLKAGKYPFWNMINGPIADALWHCGQVVMLRRASGNPFNSNVSVFQGKLRNN